MSEFLDTPVHNFSKSGIVLGPKFGVEIELEGTGDFLNLYTHTQVVEEYAYFSDIFGLKSDNSLKCPNSNNFAYELYAKSAFTKEVYEKVIPILYKVVEDKKYNTSITSSVRSATHIHINMSDFTIMQLLTFTTMFHILENVIVENCGKGRNGNTFSDTLSNCYNISNRIISFLSGKPSTFKNVFNDDIRYAALNLAALHQFGTVEFRPLRTPADNGQIILDFIDIFFMMRKVVEDKTLKSPVDVIRIYKTVGYQGFLDTIFGSSPLKDKYFLSVPYYDVLMYDGFRNVSHYVGASQIKWS